MRTRRLLQLAGLFALVSITSVAQQASFIVSQHGKKV